MIEFWMNIRVNVYVRMGIKKIVVEYVKFVISIKESVFSNALLILKKMENNIYVINRNTLLLIIIFYFILVGV